jgi:hypothetical protein
MCWKHCSFILGFMCQLVEALRQLGSSLTSSLSTITWFVTQHSTLNELTGMGGWLISTDTTVSLRYHTYSSSFHFLSGSSEAPRTLWRQTRRDETRRDPHTDELTFREPHTCWHFLKFSPFGSNLSPIYSNNLYNGCKIFLLFPQSRGPSTGPVLRSSG